MVLLSSSRQKWFFLAGIFAGDKSNEASIRVMRPFSELEADQRTHIIHSKDREWQRMEKDTTAKQKKNIIQICSYDSHEFSDNKIVINEDLHSLTLKCVWVCMCVCAYVCDFSCVRGCYSFLSLAFTFCRSEWGTFFLLSGLNHDLPQYKWMSCTSYMGKDHTLLYAIAKMVVPIY